MGGPGGGGSPSGASPPAGASFRGGGGGGGNGFFSEDEVCDLPVAMSEPFRKTVRFRVSVCTAVIIISTCLLSAIDWYWLLKLRREAASAGSLTAGSDGALWLLGIDGDEGIDTTGYVGWGLISALSCATISAAFWTPLCTVICLFDAHVHLAAQLRSTVDGLHAAEDGWGAMLLATVTNGHHRLARQTSSKLMTYSAVTCIALGHASLSAALEIGLNGPTAPLLITGAFGGFCVYVLFACCAEASRKRDTHLRMAAAGLLRAQLRSSSGHVSSMALAAHQVVTAELEGERGLTLLGIEPSGHASSWMLIGWVVLLAIAVRIGLAQPEL